jgi:Ser/Thr protein kinase RdoA (MazF antagonist)
MQVKQVKLYSELTRRGKMRRLRGLAIKALEAYPLSVKEIRFLTAETNTLFKLQTEDGERYVFRIYSDEETTLHDNQAEMFWLEALIRDTDLKVIEPIARRNGEYITILSVPGVPGEKRCAVFKWVPGRGTSGWDKPWRCCTITPRP